MGVFLWAGETFGKEFEGRSLNHRKWFDTFDIWLKIQMMLKKVRLPLFLLAVGALVLFNHCTEDDDDITICAGCPSNSPWSVPGSTECYQSFDLCDAAERGNCTICDWPPGVELLHPNRKTLVALLQLFHAFGAIEPLIKSFWWKY